MTDKNKPYTHVSDGALQVTIWENTTKEGKPYCSVTVSRRYKDSDGNYGTADNFSGGDILKLQRLLGVAYDAIDTKKRGDRGSGEGAR